MGSGTCFYVDESRGYAFILTCRHVVPGLISHKQLTTTFPGGKRHETYWQGVDDGGTDLAILVIQGNSQTPWVPIAASEPARGEDIYQVGYPHGKGPSRKLGRYLGALSGRRSHGISLPIRPGDSGSGVFRKSTKELCGVVWGWEGSGPGPRDSDSRIVAWADVDRFCELTCRRIIGKSRPWLRPQEPIAQRPPKMPPPEERPVPVPPAYPPTGIDHSKDIAALSASIGDLKKMVEGLKLVAGKDGRDGLDGLNGKDGLPGKDGSGGHRKDQTS